MRNGTSVSRAGISRIRLETNTMYLDYKYDLLDVSGDVVATKGVYTICDGGFNTHCTNMATTSAPTEFESA